MEQKDRKGISTIFYGVALLFAIMFELYWISYDQYDYLIIIGTAIIIVITAYLTFDGIKTYIEKALESRNVQNELIIKAQKAIYLSNKKNMLESERRHAELIEALKTGSGIDSKNDVNSLVQEIIRLNEELSAQIKAAEAIKDFATKNEDILKGMASKLEGSDEVNEADKDKAYEESSSYTEDAKEENIIIEEDNIEVDNTVDEEETENNSIPDEINSNEEANKPEELTSPDKNDDEKTKVIVDVAIEATEAAFLSEEDKQDPTTLFDLAEMDDTTTDEERAAVAAMAVTNEGND